MGHEGTTPIVPLILWLQRCLNRVYYPLPKDRVAVCDGDSATPADVGTRRMKN